MDAVLAVIDNLNKTLSLPHTRRNKLVLLCSAMFSCVQAGICKIFVFQGEDANNLNV